MNLPVAGVIHQTEIREAICPSVTLGPHVVDVDLFPIVQSLVTARTAPVRQRIPAASMRAIVQQFLAAHALPVDVAGFGVAGPVRNGRSEAVNLAWAVNARELARALPRSAASVLNDGRFLPNLSLRLPIVEAMWPGTALPLELHLMIQAPERDV